LLPTAGASLIVRDYRPEDLNAVKAIHAEMGMDYKLPDLNGPLFFVRKVCEHEGHVVAASMLRIEAECYLWCSGDPVQKMKAMELMQPELLGDAWLLGVENAVCWIPEAVEAKFAKRLDQLGWSRDRDGWHSYSRATERQRQL
jgi:hypothetical protein